MRIRTLMLTLGLVVAAASPAQVDTLLGGAHWWTDPPPVMTLVNAGLDLQKSARLERTSWLVAGAGFLAGTVFWAGDNVPARDVCWGLGGMGWVVWQIGAVRPKERAGQYLQQGWQEDRRYEAQPDSVGMGIPVPRARTNTVRR